MRADAGGFVGQGIEFRVTRAGKDIYVGGVEGLLEAARNSEILPNDLIFDPEAERWRFARSMQLLAGFPLRSRSAGPPGMFNRPGPPEPVVEVKKVVKRRDTTVRSLILVAALALTIIAVALIPTERTLDRGRLSSYVEANRTPDEVPQQGTVSAVTQSPGGANTVANANGPDAPGTNREVGSAPIEAASDRTGNPEGPVGEGESGMVGDQPDGSGTNVQENGPSADGETKRESENSAGGPSGSQAGETGEGRGEDDDSA